MKCLRVVWTIVLGTLLFSMAIAQAPVKKIEFVADFVQLAGDANNTLVEFHYSFPASNLTYKQGGAAFEGTLVSHVALINGKDTISDEWMATIPSATPAFQGEAYATGIRRFAAKPGNYDVKMVAEDPNNPGTKLESSFALAVKDFSAGIQISDVMLCGTLVEGSAVDPSFKRGDITTVPNPRHEFIGPDGLATVYLEMYRTNLTNDPKVYATFRVLDNVKEELLVSQFPVRTSDKALGGIYEIPLDTLTTGVYYLETTLKSYTTDSIYAKQEDRFYILNPKAPPTQRVMLTEDEEFAVSEWSVLQGKQLKLELDLAKVIETNAERDLVAGCVDDRCRQRYLFRFWKNRDPDETTAINERLEQFRAMYKRAQNMYANPAFPYGWSSDRGRTLLKFGPPNQIEQSPATMEAKPYETWFYSNLQGGVYFYFVDVRLTNRHTLVHSTLNGEVRNEKWYDQYAKVMNVNPNPESGLRPSTK